MFRPMGSKILMQMMGPKTTPLYTYQVKGLRETANRLELALANGSQLYKRGLCGPSVQCVSGGTNKELLKSLAESVLLGGCDPIKIVKHKYKMGDTWLDRSIWGEVERVEHV